MQLFSSSLTLNTANGPLEIGTKVGSFDERLNPGSVDEVRVYNRVLSQSELLALSQLPCP